MNMSFALTPEPYKSGRKTVTRRNGWKHIKIGKIYNGVDRVMGFKKGERPMIFGQHVPIDSRWEPLRRMLDDLEYGKREVIREGFPKMTPIEFVEMYCRHNKCTPDDEVNRIEFRRVLKWGELPALPNVKCPICGALVHLEEITGMVECDITGLWIADEISIDCTSAPEIDSTEWEDWFRWHWSMPYVDWLPLSNAVMAWLRGHYRFVDR